MAKEFTQRQREIMDIVATSEKASITAIGELLGQQVSTATLNRDLASLVERGYLIKQGRGRATCYLISLRYKLQAPVLLDQYFAIPVDARNGFRSFSFELLSLLREPVFSHDELERLERFADEFRVNVATITPTIHRKELERLTIELSWKSSEIEGNTYSLLETERLFLEQKAAKGKSREEAIMLINHKSCLDYILANRDVGETLKLSVLEQLHAVLTEGLHVARNIRSRIVGITGTSYAPLDNAHQLREAVELMCEIINAKANAFERAMLAVLLISYIQPFEDGNKRTGRMVSNAILIAAGLCPMSYRSVDAIEYKKASILFYEQHNLSAFKRLFTEQVEFAVKNYFR